MTVDESSSQDATLIDDDLVAALGFEPVAASNGHGIDAPDAGVDTTHDDTDRSEAAIDDVAVIDDTAIDDTVIDDTVSEATDLVDGNEDAVDDGVSDGVIVAEPASGDMADEVIDDAAIDDVSPAVDGADGDPAQGAGDVVSAGSSSFFDLDVDEDEGDGSVDASAVEVIDLDRLDEAAEVVDVAAPVDDVVDEDVVDDGGSDDGHRSVGAQALDLAEPDAVFADAVSDSAVSDSAETDSAVFDAAVFDGAVFDDEVAVGDHTEHPDQGSTESLSVIDGPMLDRTIVGEPVEPNDAAGATATAAAPQATRVKRRRRLRARKSRRVIRHIDPWSVLTFSVLFHMVVFAALLLSSVLVWNAAIASGMVENVESFIQELGDYETFEINADVMFRAAIVIAGMLTLASSVLVVLLTVVFNLISDLVGGIRVTVIEEETVRVPIDKKRSEVVAARADERLAVATTEALED